MLPESYLSHPAAVAEPVEMWVSLQAYPSYPRAEQISDREQAERGAEGRKGTDKPSLSAISRSGVSRCVSAAMSSAEKSRSCSEPSLSGHRGLKRQFVANPESEAARCAITVVRYNLGG